MEEVTHMSKARYTVETLQAGQPRAYADSVYHYRVTIEWQGLEGYKNKDAPFKLHDWSPDIVKSKLRSLTHNWKDDPKWWEPKLDYIKRISEGVYEVRIIQAYND